MELWSPQHKDPKSTRQPPPIEEFARTTFLESYNKALAASEAQKRNRSQPYGEARP